MAEVRLAVSNICWPDGKAAHEEAIDTLTRLDVPAIDIAPTKVWPQILSHGANSIGKSDIEDFKQTLRGRQISGFQSLTFGVPPNPEGQLASSIFSNLLDSWGYALEKHVHGLVDLAQRVGATTLVYGSPTTRYREAVNEEDDQFMAERFFSPLVKHAEKAGVIFGIEPVSADYTKNPFGRNADELLQTSMLMLIHGRRSFPLVPDTYAMSDGGDIVDRVIYGWSEVLHSLAPHWQVSEKGMGPVGAGTTINHRVFADALQMVVDSQNATYEPARRKSEPYDGPITLAIEMKPDQTVSVTNSLTRAVNFVREHYPVH